MNAVVLGAGGQVGTELVRLLGPDTAVPHSRLSIVDAPAVEALLAARRPEVVFNCAAYNAVDRAELEGEAAFAVNAEGPSIVAQACARHGARLVHYSTNFVFDGELDRPYVESDRPAPLSVYGRSKLAGEERALEAGARALVIRTAAVYGEGGGAGGGFPLRILARARSGQPVRVVSDQRVNPTFARDLAAATLDAVARGADGILHLAGEGCCGWDEFAQAFLDFAGERSKVESIATGDLQAAARRPRNGCLASQRGDRLRPWREALAEFAREVKYA